MKKHEFRRFIDYGILALALALIVQIGLLIPKVTTTMAGGNDWGLSSVSYTHLTLPTT